MIKKNVLIILFFIPGIFVYAQNGDKQAQELLNLVIKGEGDTIYTRMNEEMRSKTNVAMLNVIFRALERKYGNYESIGDWTTKKIAGTDLYSCDVEFETYILNFATAFDPDGKVNVLRFAPKEAKIDELADEKEIEGIEEKEIKISTGDYELPGIITLPKGRRKPPVAILVHGLGPHDRDETIGANKPFRNLAWELGKQGIAVIRYDKRTLVYDTQDATKNFDEETVNDVLTAIEVAQKTPSIDANRIFIIGHSLGGMLAPRIAERSDNKITGIIMIAAIASPLEQLLYEQVLYIASQTGSNELEKGRIEELRKQIVNARVAGTYAYNAKVGLPFNTPSSYWEFANRYKQIEVAKKLEIPMLLLQGERDYQITMKDFELWKKELAGKANASFKSYSQLNHILQEGSGMSNPYEYEKESQMPLYVIQDISQFIHNKKL